MKADWISGANAEIHILATGVADQSVKFKSAPLNESILTILFFYISGRTEKVSCFLKFQQAEIRHFPFSQIIHGHVGKLSFLTI